MGRREAEVVMLRDVTVITGATGRTGGIVANALLDRGLPVRVIGRSAERLQTLAKRGAESFLADPADVEAMTGAFAGAGAAYMCSS